PILSCFLSHASNSEGDMGLEGDMGSEVEQLIAKRAVYEEIKRLKLKPIFIAPEEIDKLPKCYKTHYQGLWVLRQSVGHAKAKQNKEKSELQMNEAVSDSTPFMNFG
ncbi:hypothetical protein PanWU01x14_175410, partial [Parasponia andersonii]